MAQNYDFLRSFTIGGKDTKHLFQIAKLNIPFLSKENEFFQVGNTDGKHFRNTRLGDYTLSIDGFIIKDNTGKTVPQVMDELKALVNSDEPQKLVFDIFPDRYFNAIFTGAEEYDATDLKYTPLTLTFDVPDGLAHSIESIGFSNTYSTTTNLMLDSEYNAINKYMKAWVKKLDKKFNGSNIVQGDFTNGVPVIFEYDRNSDERWLNLNSSTVIHVDELKAGDEVNFSVYAQVVSIDEANDKQYAGQVVLEEWDTVKGVILKRHFVNIPKKVNAEFTEYGSVVKISNEKTNALNLQYGFKGSTLINWSKPMVSLLPPLGETVTAPSVGAKAYSSSVDFGDYDYSGNPNLMANINADSFSQGKGALSVVDDGNEVVVTLDPSTKLDVYKMKSQPGLVAGKTYTMSAEIMLEDDFTGDPSKIALRYFKLPDLVPALTTRSTLTADKGIWQKITVTSKMTTAIDNAESWYVTLYNQDANNSLSGKLRLRHAKVEYGSEATPYQPNLLDAPYYLSKAPLGENLITNAKFPINTPNNPISGFDISEELIIGETYTVSLKGTKPANKEFHLYYGEANYQQSQYQATLLPVEGLANVWSATFTARKTSEMTNLLRVALWQKPNSATYDTVQIDWLKIEKGGIRTPNIPYYKYEGIAPAPSNNPKDYHWGYSPSYINAVEYVPSGDSVGDLIKINNNGTYRTKPRFSFRMKGENGLVGLLNQNGAILQFGNPEDVDGTISSRVEQGLDENFWGNTLNPTLQLNTGFKSVYPNRYNNPTTPNLVQGTWDMRPDPDSATPVFTSVGPINVWHGPSVVANIQPPSNTDRTLPISNHYRFVFDNYNKGQRGRIEFGTFDESGNPIMSAIIRDSNHAQNEIVFEAWYKNQKLHQQHLDRKIFWSTFYEMNMDRRGNKLIWRMVQIKDLGMNPGGWSTASIDKEYKFTWTLPEPDTSKFTKSGAWVMRFSNSYHVIMRLTDIQARWEGTPYYQDLKNYFQDGDLVEIDTATREFFVNGVLNNQLNVVGNQWEKFELETGETIIQPIVSEWANMAEVTAEITQNYL